MVYFSEIDLLSRYSAACGPSLKKRLNSLRGRRPQTRVVNCGVHPCSAETQRWAKSSSNNQRNRGRGALGQEIMKA
jgi:hypothetical protein